MTVAAARDNHALKSLVQNVHRGMRCVARRAILLEPHVVGIHIIHFRPQEVASSICSVRRWWLWQRPLRFKRSTMIPPDQNPHQTVTFSRCIWSWCISRGLISSQIRQFCLFTYPFIHQKWASSLKMICLAKCAERLSNGALILIIKFYDLHTLLNTMTFHGDLPY